MSEAPAIPTRTTWLSTAERGTLLGIRAVFFLATVGGRLPARMLVRGIALWYALFDGNAKRSSRQWLAAVHGRAPRFGEVYRHILRFSQVTLDRIFFLTGKTRAFRVTRTGDHHLRDALAAGKGAVLLGAHLGSFEAMRAGGEEDAVPINILGHFANAKMINSLFEQLNPQAAARVIHIGADSVDFIFAVRDRLARGELVAILGDRVGLHEKSVTVQFFGRPARFPTGPFVLASLLDCPVFLTFGIYVEPNRYDLHCEPFAESLVLPRRDRAQHLQAVVQRYAERLEAYCRGAPDNWFNFYDFWQGEADAEPASSDLSPGPCL